MNKKLLNLVIFSLAFMMIANMIGFSEAAIETDTQRSNVVEERIYIPVEATGIKGVELAAADGIVNKYAVIIGISDYSAVSDLSYCDEDASDWYNYLAPLGYDIILLGDGTNTYPVPIDGLATEYNMKQAVANILAVADEDDIIVYATSGHGSELKIGRGRDATYEQLICAWDYGVGENGEDGKLFDYEFAQMWAPAVSNVFIFVDHCFAGGMDELFDNPNADCFYMTTTCTADGYGYDMSAYENGKWTYWYLEAGLVSEGFTDLNLCFDWAHANYEFRHDRDEPLEFGVADFTL